MTNKKTEPFHKQTTMSLTTEPQISCSTHERLWSPISMPTMLMTIPDGWLIISLCCGLLCILGQKSSQKCKCLQKLCAETYTLRSLGLKIHSSIWELYSSRQVTLHLPIALSTVQFFEGIPLTCLLPPDYWIMIYNLYCYFDVWHRSTLTPVMPRFFETCIRYFSFL